MADARRAAITHKTAAPVNENSTFVRRNGRTLLIGSLCWALGPPWKELSCERGEGVRRATLRRRRCVVERFKHRQRLVDHCLAGADLQLAVPARPRLVAAVGIRFAVRYVADVAVLEQQRLLRPIVSSWLWPKSTAACVSDFAKTPNPPAATALTRVRRVNVLIIRLLIGPLIRTQTGYVQSGHRPSMLAKRHAVFQFTIRFITMERGCWSMVTRPCIAPERCQASILPRRRPQRSLCSPMVCGS